MAKTTKREFLKRMGILAERIRQDVTPFEDMSPTAVAERKILGQKNDMTFAKLYFPHECEKAFAPWHGEMFKMADTKNKIIVILGSRGSTKTTLVGKIKRIKRALYRQRRFLAFVGETEEMATERTGDIRVEFENNTRLIGDFGDLRTLSPWEWSNFRIANGAYFKAFGWRSRVRGSIRRGVRIDDICVDDYEDSQTKYNPKIVAKKLEKLKQDFLGATNLKDFHFTFLGNYFSKISVAHALKEDPETVTKTFLIDEGNGQPTWPEMYSKSALRELRKVMGELNYNVEILQIPRDDVDAIIKEGWLKEWLERDLKKKTVRRFGFLDPSMKKGAANDFKALITMKVTERPLEYFTDRCWIRHASVNDMVDIIFKIYKEENLNCLGIESNEIEEYLDELIKQKATQVGWHPHIEWVHHKDSKESRILPKTSLIERGIARFQTHNSDQYLLLDQLKFLLKPGVHDDGPDAWAACIDLANKHIQKPEYIPVRKTGIGRFLKKGAW